MEYVAYIYFAEHRICKISYYDNEKDSYEYIFEPIYKAIDSLLNTPFRGIQGLDLSLRRQKYVRHNFQPVFIFEHNPIPGKKDFQSLQRVGRITLLEYMANNNLQYFGDNLKVRPI